MKPLAYQVLEIPTSLHAAMLAQAEAELPNECCGLLAGRIVGEVGRVVERFPLVNKLASPVAYLSEERSMFDAMRAIDRLGLEWLAVYHSHPTSPPFPSRRDREESCGASVMHLIVSLMDRPIVVRAWWLTASEQREADWRIDPSA
jgi:proteasome lid subunit RPN8/RPN11